jgi:hypothetical protein
MTYNATVKLCYINDTETSNNKYFPEIVDKQTITIEAPAHDLNVWQHFELFKGFLRAIGFAEYSIMDAACRTAFNDSNDEAQMKKLADEYDLFLEEDYHKKIRQLEKEQEEDVATLKAEINELKEKLARVLPEQYGKRDEVLPEQYKSWDILVPGSPEAVVFGCKCPVMDNAEMPDDKKWVSSDCPLHGKVK